MEYYLIIFKNIIFHARVGRLTINADLKKYIHIILTHFSKHLLIEINTPLEILVFSGIESSYHMQII
jgi:hypothetical protein